MFVWCDLLNSLLSWSIPSFILIHIIHHHSCFQIQFNCNTYIPCLPIAVRIADQQRDTKHFSKFRLPFFPASFLPSGLKFEASTISSIYSRFSTSPDSSINSHQYLASHARCWVALSVILWWSPAFARSRCAHSRWTKQMPRISSILLWTWRRTITVSIDMVSTSQNQSTPPKQLFRHCVRPLKEIWYSQWGFAMSLPLLRETSRLTNFNVQTW